MAILLGLTKPSPAIRVTPGQHEETHMEDSTLMRAVRKALRNRPLDSAEAEALAEWRGQSSILEASSQSNKPLDAALADIREATAIGRIREIFDSLFNSRCQGDGETGNARRQLPVLADRDLYNADLETSDGPTPAHYELWELDDLIPSHNPLKHFARRGDYPEDRRARPYDADEGEREKVERLAAGLNPRFLLNSNPDSRTGPPVIAANGVVLAGNARVMALQLARVKYPGQADAYGAQLLTMAPQFGFSPAQVAKMTGPVLVRVVER